MYEINLFIMFISALLNFYYLYKIGKVTTKRAMKFIPVMDFSNKDVSIRNLNYKYLIVSAILLMSALLSNYLKNHRM